MTLDHKRKLEMGLKAGMPGWRLCDSPIRGQWWGAGTLLCSPIMAMTSWGRWTVSVPTYSVTVPGTTVITLQTPHISVWLMPHQEEELIPEPHWCCALRQHLCVCTFIRLLSASLGVEGMLTWKADASKLPFTSASSSLPCERALLLTHLEFDSHCRSGR